MATQGFVPSSQAKLDELFLLWLSLPEAQHYVQDLVECVRRGQPIHIPLSVKVNHLDRLGSDEYVSSPKHSPKQTAMSPPPRSPTGHKGKGGGAFFSDDPMRFSTLSPPNSDAGKSHPMDTSLSPEATEHPVHHMHALHPHQTKHLDDDDDDDDGYEQQTKHLEPLPVQTHVHQPHTHQLHPAPAPALPNSASQIPRFWFPKDAHAPTLEAQRASEESEIHALFRQHPGGISCENFSVFTTKVCGYPSFFNPSLYAKVAGGSSPPPQVKFEQAKEWWSMNIERRDPATRLFNLLRKPGNDYVHRDDWKQHLAHLLSIHPGLEFLKATPEFQERYLECVVERIYYANCNIDSDKMTQKEIKRSNLVNVLHVVDEEADINLINDYFSYEHFYVLYCKFWELDTDHDFLLDREDVVKLGNYSLTYRVVDRIFEGACRKITSGVADKLGYQDFIWLLLSEEDKTSDTALRYWFRGIDLDGDGYIRPYEMEFFYKEQIHRMDCLAQEVIQFADVLCQMSDMVKPAKEGYISMIDLAKCRQQGTFFNVLFNLTKFIQSEQRDPNQIFHERATPELTDWDRYAKVEYARLSMEEEEEGGEWEGEAPGVGMDMFAMAIDSKTA